MMTCTAGHPPRSAVLRVVVTERLSAPATSRLKLPRLSTDRQAQRGLGGHTRSGQRFGVSTNVRGFPGNKIEGSVVLRSKINKRRFSQ